MKKIVLFSAIILSIVLGSCSSSKKAGGAGPGSIAASKEATYKQFIYTGKHRLLDDNTFRLDSISVDETYGYTSENPVMVGGEIENGAKNERRFLNALLGSHGESVSYNRTGSCCRFNSPGGFMGGGLLDRYEVKIEGTATTVIIYINMYDKGILRAPKGFTFR